MAKGTAGSAVQELAVMINTMYSGTGLDQARNEIQAFQSSLGKMRSNLSALKDKDWLKSLKIESINDFGEAFERVGGKLRVIPFQEVQRRIDALNKATSRIPIKDVVRPIDEIADATKQFNQQKKADILSAAGITAKGGKYLDSVSGKILNTVESTKRLDNAQQKLYGSAVKINTIMNALGVTFAAMFAQRAVMGLFKNMIKTFRDTAAKTNPLSIAMTRLEANFTFLKYAIIEAAGPFLTAIINWMGDLVNWVGSLDEGQLELIGYGLMAIVAALGFFVVGGQLFMGISSFLNILKDLKDAKMIAGLKDLKNVLFGLGGLVLSIKAVWDVFADDKPLSMESLLKNLVTGALGGFLIALWAGASIGTAGLSAVLAASIILELSIMKDIINKAGQPLSWLDLIKYIFAGSLAGAIGGASIAAIAGAGAVAGVIPGIVIGVTIVVTTLITSRNLVALEKEMDTLKEITSNPLSPEFQALMKAGFRPFEMLSITPAAQKILDDVKNNPDKYKVDISLSAWASGETDKTKSALDSVTSAAKQLSDFTYDPAGFLASLNAVDPANIDKIAASLYGNEKSLFLSLTQVGKVLSGTKETEGLNLGMAKLTINLQNIQTELNKATTNIIPPFIEELGLETTAHYSNASAINAEYTALKLLNEEKLK